MPGRGFPAALARLNLSSTGLTVIAELLFPKEERKRKSKRMEIWQGTKVEANAASASYIPLLQVISVLASPLCGLGGPILRKKHRK